MGLQEGRVESSKARRGIRDGCEVFFDPFVCFIGIDVVSRERREIVIGMTVDWRILRVVYVFRKDQIRVVSARPVTTQERKTYEDQ
jgi:uncharacterized protein